MLKLANILFLTFNPLWSEPHNQPVIGGKMELLVYFKLLPITTKNNDCLVRIDQRETTADEYRFEAFGLIDTAFLVGDLCASIPAFRLHPPPALGDWKHILLAKLTLLGIQKFRKWYDRLLSRSLKDV
jgi:hypothetical protein